MSEDKGLTTSEDLVKDAKYKDIFSSKKLKTKVVAHKQKQRMKHVRE